MIAYFFFLSVEKHGFQDKGFLFTVYIGNTLRKSSHLKQLDPFEIIWHKWSLGDSLPRLFY